MFDIETQDLAVHLVCSIHGVIAECVLEDSFLGSSVELLQEMVEVRDDDRKDCPLSQLVMKRGSKPSKKFANISHTMQVALQKTSLNVPTVRRICK